MGAAAHHQMSYNGGEVSNYNDKLNNSQWMNSY